MLKESGYKGEKLVFLVPADLASIKAQGEVVADALQQVGFNIDMQVMDWGTVLARANNRQGPDKGGWHIVGTFTAGVGLLNPSSNNLLRGTGQSAIFGWSDIPQLEELRTAWFQAASEVEQTAICTDIQRVAFDTVPYVPTGLYFQQTAHRRSLTDIQKGMPLFYLFVAGGGVAGDEAVLPDPWVDAANRVSFEVAPHDNSYGAVGYGYSWWIDEDGAMVAVGFAGQSLYVNRARGVVIVKLSCQPQPPYATANTVDFRRERTLSRTPSSAANRKRLSPVSLLKL